MNVKLNVHLEENCFQYLVLQAMVDGGCVMDVVCRMNEFYEMFGTLKCVPSDKRLS